MAGDKEIAAMSEMAAALDGFAESDQATVERILHWLCARYNVEIFGKLEQQPAGGSAGEGNAVSGTATGRGFDDLADVFHAASPKTEAEKALVAAYWMSVGEGKLEFTAQEVNKSLKNLGHGIVNITDALTKLMGKKPSLVMQTAKSGASKQARKKYKLTRAGLDAVPRMV